MKIPLKVYEDFLSLLRTFHAISAVATITDPTKTTTTATTAPMIAPSTEGPPGAGGSWDGVTTLLTMLLATPDRPPLSLPPIDGDGVDPTMLEGTLPIVVGLPGRPEIKAEDVTILLIRPGSEWEIDSCGVTALYTSVWNLH